MTVLSLTLLDIYAPYTGALWWIPNILSTLLRYVGAMQFAALTPKFIVGL